MRLWSLHPQYLDSKGLVALWREALLAQKVLKNQTKGYKNHPQLDRFKASAQPAALLGTYLTAVYDESLQRGYNFNQAKIEATLPQASLTVTSGQLAYELEHLKGKLKVRDETRYQQIATLQMPQPHPLFTVIPGPIEPWEVINESDA